MSRKTNIIKRYAQLRQLDIEMLEHPIFEEVKELYINNKIKSISSVKSYLKKMKLKKNGELYKTALNKLEKIKQMTDDLIEEQNQLRYIKEQEKIKQQREQEKRNKEFQENRDIDSFVEQINESFTNKEYILSELEMQILRAKLLSSRYKLEIKYIEDNKLYYKTFSEKYIDSLLNFLNDGYDGYTTLDKISYSDGEESYNYDEVEKIDIIEINEDNVNFIDNKNGLFFNYLNNCKI